VLSFLAERMKCGRALEQDTLFHFIDHLGQTDFLCMHLSRPMLDFALPVLGLASYPEHPEEVVHCQTDAPADQREEEPQEPWNKHQVASHQRATRSASYH
jgi:hypothetical protein